MTKAGFLIASLSTSAFAQGTISFTNFEIPNPNGVGSYNAPITVLGQPAGKLGFTAGLFKDQTQLSAVPFFGETAFFVGPEVVIPNSPANSTPTLSVRIWPSAFGSYAEAQAAGEFYLGASVPFTTQPLGGPNPVPPPPAIFTPGMTGFQGLNLIPEPSVCALGFIGLGFLTIIRNRQ